MNSHREYYRVRVLRSNGYTVNTRKRQVDCLTENHIDGEQIPP